MRLTKDLMRDLNQEITEYNLTTRETWKAKLLLDSYRLMGNSILKMCKFAETEEKY
jgi:predicted glycosyltransferase